MKIQMDVFNVRQLDYFARAFSKLVKPPMVILLVGDLGSGKTTFVKRLAKYLGSDAEVTSPTFTLLNEYDGKFPIYHFDMYRLSSAEEAKAVGFEEYFDKQRLDGVCFVEWPENVEGLIKQFDYEIEITKRGERLRTVLIKENSHAGN